MNKKQQEQVAVQKSVMEVMEGNLAKWQSVSELKRKYDRFIRILKKIDDYNAALQIDLSPLKENKTKSKKELVGMVFPVTSVLGVYAFDMGDSKLGKLVNVKFSDIEKMKTSELEQYCFKILRISTKLLEFKQDSDKKPPKHLIADYGMNARHLQSLKFALDSFVRSEVALSEARLKKKKSKEKLKKSIGENNRILKKKMDLMMHLFRDSQKIFYAAYIKSRIPVEATKTSPGKMQIKDETTDKSTSAVTRKPSGASKPAGAGKSSAPRKPSGSGSGKAGT